MTETVVHVTTLEQWKSVLDVWFKQGYEWFSSGNVYAEKLFEQNSANQLGLVDYGFKYIVCWINNDYDGDNLIEYKQFMEEQQKEDNKVKTYYVTQEQLDLLEELKSLPMPLVAIMNKQYGIDKLYNELLLSDTEWFNYLSGDNKIEFKVKTPAIEPEEEPLTTPTEEPDANREVTIVLQNGEMKSFTDVTNISLNNGTLTFNYPQGDYGNTIMEATFYTNTISGYLTNSI